MNIIFICQIAFGISVFGILFILLRNLPVLVEFEPRPIPKNKKLYFRLKKGFLIVKQKSGEKFHRLRERNLHRLKVWTLKVDNFLTSYLKRTQERRLHQKRSHSEKKEREKSKSEISKESKDNFKRP